MPKPNGGASCLVILPDVPERLVEQVLIFDLVLHVDYLAKLFPHLAFSGFRVLPAWEADDSDDLIDLGDDPLHDHGCFAVLGFRENVREVVKLSAASWSLRAGTNLLKLETL